MAYTTTLKSGKILTQGTPYQNLSEAEKAEIKGSGLVYLFKGGKFTPTPEQVGFAYVSAKGLSKDITDLASVGLGTPEQQQAYINTLAGKQVKWGVGQAGEEAKIAKDIAAGEKAGAYGYTTGQTTPLAGATQPPTTTIKPEDYWLKQGETTEQYNTRIVALRAGTTTPTPTIQPTATQPVSTYIGVSIVDYLKSVGQPSDYNSRAKLAAQQGITNYTGTAAQNTQLLNTLRSETTTQAPTITQGAYTPLGTLPVQQAGETTEAFNQKLQAYYGTPTTTTAIWKEPTTTTDVSAGVVSAPPLIQPQAPSVQEQYTQGALANLQTTRNTLELAYQKQIDTITKQREVSQEKIDELTAKEKAMIETDIQPLMAPYRETLEKSERERLKVEENYFENQKLTDELGGLLTQIQADLQATKDVTGLAAIRNPRIAKATETATARVGVIEATMAARNNQISVAYTLIDRSANAIASDRQDQLNYYKTLLSFYDKQRDEEGEKLVNLTKEEKTWITAQVNLLENDMNVAQTNVEYIKKLMMDPDTAQTVAMSGVTLNDSPQQVQQKFATYAYGQELINTSNKMSTNGYQYMSDAQAATKPQDEIIVTIDSKGIIKKWWKAKEVEEVEQWSNPYLLGGDYVQKNLKTGQIRTAVNVAVGTGYGYKENTKTSDELPSWLTS